MSHKFYDPFAVRSWAARDATGVTHEATTVGERMVSLCGSPLGLGQRCEDSVDCITCIVLRDRSAAEVPR